MLDGITAGITFQRVKAAVQGYGWFQTNRDHPVTGLRLTDIVLDLGK
jgi:hypothetical protein